MKPVVIVHGGAWAVPDSLAERSVAGVQRAAKAAWNVLKNGGQAIDAVEAAVTDLENNPVFDAGTGSVLTGDGTVEMDALIMEGTTLRVGAVACVENIKNPIQLARQVMELTDHTMLVGKGANKFAEECGIVSVPLEELITPEAIESLEMLKKYQCTVQTLFASGQCHDTVGCVVMDGNGHLAAGTSTGGITAKRIGRVGDSPLVGCGGYADDNAAAVSCTGHGESISRICLASMITQQCRIGSNPDSAVQNSLKYMSHRMVGAGGAICVDSQGRIGIGFTTERMPWCYITESESMYGLNQNEQIVFV